MARSVWPGMAAWTPALLYMGLIFAISGTPTIPKAYASVIDFVGDKALHAGAYAVLSGFYLLALACTAPRLSPLQQVAAAAVLAVLYGASDEWHQTFVIGRKAEWGDWLADALGAVLAAAVLYYPLLRLRARPSAN